MTRADLTFRERITLPPCIGSGHGPADGQGRDHVTITRIFVPLAEPGAPVDAILAIALPA